MRIYVVRFVTWAAWSVFFSFMSLWLLRGQVLTPDEVGWVVGAAALANRAGALAFASWIHRVSVRRSVMASQVGLAGSVLVMHGLAVHGVSDLLSWLGAGVMAGVSSSVATLAQITYIARGSKEAEKLTALSYENVALNLSAGLSPLVSSLILTRYPDAYAIAPLVPCALSIAMVAGMPTRDVREPVAVSVDDDDAPASPGAGRVMFVVLNVLIFFASTQFYNVFPVYAKEAMGVGEVGVMFAVSSVLIVVLQMPVTRVVTRCRAVTAAMLAYACMAAGVVGLYFSPDIAVVAYGTVLLLTISEIIFGPLFQSMVIRVFASRSTFAMGTLMLIWAVSELVATVIGIKLVSQGQAWAAFGVAAAGCVAAMVMLAVQRRRQPRDGLARVMNAVP